MPTEPPPTDADVRLALVAHALDAASRSSDPAAPAVRDYLRKVLAADPAAVRVRLAKNPAGRA